MYSGNNKSKDIMTNIEGSDVFNSSIIFLMEVSNIKLKRVNKFEDRLDLISDYIYSNKDNYGLLAVLNRSTLCKLGSFIKYIDTSRLIHDLGMNKEI